MAALLNLNILLADDEEDDLFLLRRLFKRVEGIGSCVEVRHGEDVLAYLLGQGKFSDRVRWPFPGILILDQHMPRLSGIDVLCWIRTEPRFSKLPVVLLSGELSSTETATVRTLHAAYCHKAIDLTGREQAMEAAILTALRLTRDPSVRESGDAVAESYFLASHALVEDDACRT